MLAIEVGGTTMRAARLTPDGSRVESVLTRPTPSITSRGAGPDDEPGTASEHAQVLAAAAALGKEALRGRQPAAVGVAYPGPMDGQGRVIAAPTVLHRTGGEVLDLLGACRAQWPTATVRVMNDLTAAGEWFVATGLRDFAVVTVGSGIGHKVFLDGRPRVGAGRGGEIGHLRLDWGDDAPQCDCGGIGHLGGLASGRGTVAMVRRAALRDPAGFRGSALVAPTSVGVANSVASLEWVTGPVVADAYRRGDPFTRVAVSEAVRFLGQALAAIHLDTGVEDLILTGGFATAMGGDYRREVALAAGAATWAVGQNWDTMVRLGPPSNDTGLIGAGLVAARALSLDPPMSSGV